MDLSRAAVLVCVLVAGMAVDSQAQFVAFDAEISGETRTANVSTRVIEGVEYVPLGDLVQGIGGAYRDSSRRMTVEFAGTRAWVQMDDKRVNALSLFTLSQPIRRVDGRMYIARSEVAAFFQQGFRVTVREGQAGASIPEEPLARPETRTVTSRGVEAVEPLEVETLSNDTARRTGVTGIGATGSAPDRPIRSIVIDAGHGGKDVGATGRSGAAEKDITLSVALAVWKLLSDRLDIAVEVTRGDDLDMTLQERALYSAKYEADLLLSIHVGGSASPDALGAAVFYPPAGQDDSPGYSITAAGSPPRPRYRDWGDQSRDVATAIADALEADESLAFRRVYEVPCRLLSHAAVPGVLIEVGCITNPAEEILLQNEDELARIAARIAYGVLVYVDAPEAVALGVLNAEPDGQD